MATRSEECTCIDSVGTEYGKLALRYTPPKVRNVLILGKAGVGKSTVANQILGSQVFQISTPVDSVTRQFRSNIVTGHAGKNDTMYNIKLIDTVGQTNSFSIEHIVDDMKHFLERFPAGIHLILFVSKNARFTNEDCKAFNFIIKMFGDSIADISALVVTCCEGLHEKAREGLVKEFYEKENTKDITCAMKKGVFTVGFPTVDTVKLELQPIYKESAKKDEEKLRLLVDGCGLMIMPLNEFQWSEWLRSLKRRRCELMFITVIALTVLLIHFGHFDCLSRGRNIF